MKNTLSLKTSVTVNASPERVWKALISPAMIKKYLMGTDVSTDWKEGSPISYTGEYNGIHYHDKGVIKKIVPEKILQSTYFSSMSGKEDKDENYNLVTYELDAEGGKTFLSVTQENIADEKEKDHSLKNWKMVLNTLKDIVEKTDY